MLCMLISRYFKLIVVMYNVIILIILIILINYFAC